MSPSLAITADQSSSFQSANLATPWTQLLVQGDGGERSSIQANPTIRFAANTEIYSEGDETRSFYKIVSGVVRICKFLSDGRRQIDAFHEAGEIFGFEASSKHRLSAEAVSDCVVIPYRHFGLAEMAVENDRAAKQFFSYAMHCLERAQEHSLLLGRCNAAQRLAGFLLEMLARHPGKDLIDLAMTRQDIADYLGLTIETVSRTFSQFERSGLITLPTVRCVRIKNHASLRALNS